MNAQNQELWTELSIVQSRRLALDDQERMLDDKARALADRAKCLDLRERELNARMTDLGKQEDSLSASYIIENFDLSDDELKQLVRSLQSKLSKKQSAQRGPQ
jgi:hypothetical protein